MAYHRLKNGSNGAKINYDAVQKELNSSPNSQNEWDASMARLSTDA